MTTWVGTERDGDQKRVEAAAEDLAARLRVRASHGDAAVVAALLGHLRDQSKRAEALAGGEPAVKEVDSDEEAPPKEPTKRGRPRKGSSTPAAAPSLPLAPDSSASSTASPPTDPVAAARVAMEAAAQAVTDAGPIS